MGLEKSWNGDLSVTTLNPQPVFPELYYPLWWWSGSSEYQNGNTAGNAFIGKGATTVYGDTSSSVTHLYTHSSTWSASTDCALEAALRVTSGTGNIQLYDVTSGSLVSGAILTATSATTTVMRTGKFNLIPGHTYALSQWSIAGDVIYITDVSLIIFPQAPLTSPSISSISLANPSGNTLKEAYIPLWVYSSGATNIANQLTSGQLIMKGQLGELNGIDSRVKLYSLNSNWSASQKFAFECSMYASSATTVYAALWDCTSNSIVSTSQVSTPATTATLVRSGQFTLTPGHSYGVTIWTGGNVYVYLNKAHLVALA